MAWLFFFCSIISSDPLPAELRHPPILSGGDTATELYEAGDVAEVDAIAIEWC